MATRHWGHRLAGAVGWQQAGVCGARRRLHHSKGKPAGDRPVWQCAMPGRLFSAACGCTWVVICTRLPTVPTAQPRCILCTAALDWLGLVFCPASAAWGLRLAVVLAVDVVPPTRLHSLPPCDTARVSLRICRRGMTRFGVKKNKLTVTDCTVQVPTSEYNWWRDVFDALLAGDPGVTSWFEWPFVSSNTMQASSEVPGCDGARRLSSRNRLPCDGRWGLQA